MGVLCSYKRLLKVSLEGVRSSDCPLETNVWRPDQHHRDTAQPWASSWLVSKASSSLLLRTSTLSPSYTGDSAQEMS